SLPVSASRNRVSLPSGDKNWELTIRYWLLAAKQTVDRGGIVRTKRRRERSRSQTPSMVLSGSCPGGLPTITNLRLSRLNSIACGTSAPAMSTSTIARDAFRVRTFQMVAPRPSALLATNHAPSALSAWTPVLFGAQGKEPTSAISGIETTTTL